MNFFHFCQTNFHWKTRQKPAGIRLAISLENYFSNHLNKML